jgi:hypothetical protein
MAWAHTSVASTAKAPVGPFRPQVRCDSLGLWPSHAPASGLLQTVVPIGLAKAVVLGTIPTGPTVTVFTRAARSTAVGADRRVGVGAVSCWYTGRWTRGIMDSDPRTRSYRSWELDPNRASLPCSQSSAWLARGRSPMCGDSLMP